MKSKRINHNQQPEVIACQGGRGMFKICYPISNKSCLEMAHQTQNLPADIINITGE